MAYQLPNVDWIPEAIRDMTARAYDQGKHDGWVEGYKQSMTDRADIEKEIQE